MGVTSAEPATNARFRRGLVVSAGLGALVLYIVLYILPLGYLPLTIPDEARYAEIPREMLNSGNWIVPHLDGLRYFEKPPLGYWVGAVAIALFGENPFAVRLPSAIATATTAYLVYLFAGYTGARREIAVLAATIYLTFLEVYVVGTTNILDSLLALFLTAAIVFAYKAASDQITSASRVSWVLSGVFMGCAFLTKGFLAFAVPAIVLLPWIAWEGHWRMLTGRAWLALAAIVIVALPWSLLVFAKETDFWNYFFWVEHIKRFFADNAQHKAPFYYFIVYLPLFAFPWISLLPAALKGLRRPANGPERGAKRLLWLWLVLPFLFFSASNGKLPAYILPCFVPLAVLIAVGLERNLERADDRLFDIGVLFNALILACLFSVVVISQSFGIGFRLYEASESWRAVFLAASLLAAAALAPVAILARRAEAKLLGAVLMLCPVLLALHFVMPDEAWRHQAPGKLLAPARTGIPDNAVVISDGSTIHAVTWYLKRNDIYLSDAGELEYGLGYADAAGRLLDKEKLAALLVRNDGKRAVAMVCKHSCDPELLGVFPVDHMELSQYGEFIMWYFAGVAEGVAAPISAEGR